VQFLTGDIVARGCTTDPLSGLRFEVNQGLNGSRAGRDNKDVTLYLCNGEDLCNGSSRLAEISIMMILLPVSLVFFISFFSKL